MQAFVDFLKAIYDSSVFISPRVTMSFLAVAVVVVLSVSLSRSSDVFTSSSRIQAMLATERDQVDGLGNFLEYARSNKDTLFATEEEDDSDEEEEDDDSITGSFGTLEEIERFYQQARERGQSLWENDKSIQQFVRHPTNAFFAIRHANYWFRLRHNVSSSLQGELTRFLPNVYSPGPRDLEGAAAAIVRLQQTYGLKADHVFRGDVLGYQGVPLTAKDAMLIARAARDNDKQREAVEWLKLILNLSNVTDSERAAVLGQLGMTEFLMGNHGKAQEYLHRAEQIDRYQSDVHDLRIRLRSGNPPEHPTTLAQMVLGKEEEDFNRNFSRLCSSSVTVGKLLAIHRCRYKCTSVPYLRYKEEIVSHRPYASIFHDVLADWEAEKLKRIASNRGMQRGVLVNDPGTKTTNYRTSDTLFVYDFEEPFVAKLSRRVTAITGLETKQSSPNKGSDSSEPFQFVNYGIGGHYAGHMDAFDQEKVYVDVLRESGDRMATFLFYLSDVDIGGRTVFNRMEISIPPQKGTALFWFNYSPDDRVDTLTMHAGCPVAVGEKWVVNKWIWHYGNTFRRPCPRNRKASQWKLEQQFHTTCPT